MIEKKVKKGRYVRVSTIGQNPNRQLVDFDGKIYTDKVSGITPFAERPKGSKLLKDVENEVINYVEVHSVDRLGRDSHDISTTIKFLKEHNCNVRINDLGIEMFLENGKVNPAFDIVVMLLGVIAQQTRENIKESQMQGIEIAKIEGKYQKRKTRGKANKEELLKKHYNIVALLKDGKSMNEVSKLLNKNYRTVMKINKLLKEQ